MEGYTLERCFPGRAESLLKLGCIKISEADLDPLIGIRRPADAKTVSVTNVPDGAGESHSSLGWQRCFARICICGGAAAERGEDASKQEGQGSHAAAFNVPLPLPLFFFRSARMYLSQRAMPARFSGM